MNITELRRLVLVVLPAGLTIAIAAIIVGIALQPEGAGEPTNAGGPRIGRDHWHATYQVFVCGERQPNLPTFEAGVHTHADGVIHIHPFVPSEEGEGARLVKFFEYGGGRLTQDEMQMPGSRETFRNGDACPDGSLGVLQLFVNGEELGGWERYIPQDGDRILIVFGPPEEVEPAPARPPPAPTLTPVPPLD